MFTCTAASYTKRIMFSMRLWGDRYNRDLQRYNLALRMIVLQARTHTIAYWTGLPDDRIRNLYQSYYQEPGIQPVHRRRGPSPQSLSFFFGTARSRSESAAIVGLCYLLGVLPAQPLANPRLELPSVARGKRLCDAFELYRQLVPHSLMTLDHVVLLIMTVAQGYEFRVGHCMSCGGVIVIDRSSLRRCRCAHCGDDLSRSPPAAELPELITERPLQRELFAEVAQRDDRTRIRRE
jgi:hypothetical protein